MSTDSNSQVNFNPSWMQPAAPLKSVDRPNGLINRPSSEDADASQEMIDPVFAKHRYGREDLLALMGKDSAKPPDGLEKCAFFVEKPQMPIILLALNETELRLQQNINSSKALSALSRQDRQTMMSNGAEVGSPSGGNSGWITAGSNRGGGNGMSHGHKPTASRWSALAPSGNPNEGQSFRNSRGGGAQSTFNKNSRQPHGEHRPAAVNRYRVPSTNADTQATSTHSENVAKVLESHSPQVPSAATANIWAKIGVSVKNENETSPKGGTDSERPPIAAQTSADDWMKFKPGLGDDTQRSLLYGSNKAADILETLGVDTTPSIDTQSQSSPVKSLEHQQKLQSVSAPGGVQLADKVEWFYLDPSNIQRGPFDTQQMQGWYEGRYFDASLRLRRGTDKEFTTLGELFNINGTATPFNYKMDINYQVSSGLVQNLTGSMADSVSQMSNSLHHSPRIDAATSIWTSLSRNLDNRSASATTSTIAPEFSAILSDVPTGANGGMKSPQNIELLMKERQIAEEKRKLQEKEEQLRKEEQEREEKQRRIQEMEMELRRKEEELQRIAREKEQELVNKQRQMAEFERKKLEALQLMEQKLRNDHIEQQRRKEEEERRREQEIEERLQQERQRQRLLLEAEAQRKREEEETKIRLAYEEARRLQLEALEVARRAEEEQRRRLQEENQARIRKEAEDAKAAQEAERRRKKQEKQAKEAEERRLEEQRQQELERQRREEDELNRAAIEAILSSSPPPKAEKIPPAPWVTVGGSKTNAKKPGGPSNRKEQNKQSHQTHPSQKSLLEIQKEEEERVMQEKLKKQKETTDRKSAQEPRPTSQKSVWGAPPQSYQVNPIFDDAPSLPAHSTQQSSTSGTRSWNSVPTTQPIPIPKSNNAKTQPQKNQKKQKAIIKISDEKPKQADAFTSWIIKRVRELNSSVDAEVFASFIEGVDSPNEAEDYIVGYLGESKSVKEFHREFLQKRIELRPRVQPTTKDDLSGPAAAAGLANSSSSTTGHNSGPNHNGNSSATAAAKKKKKAGKGQGKVVLDGLGFRPTGDPNRVNAGEIDNAPPMPTKKNR